MYPCATDDTLLHLGYEVLTALELDLPFALKMLTLIQTDEFLALLNLANTPETFAKVFRTGIVVGDFLHAIRTFTITTGSLQRKQWRRPGGADRRVGSRCDPANTGCQRLVKMRGRRALDRRGARVTMALSNEFAAVSACDLPLTFAQKAKKPLSAHYRRKAIERVADSRISAAQAQKSIAALT